MLKVQENKMPFMGKREIIGSKHLKKIQEEKLLKKAMMKKADDQAKKLMSLSDKQELKDILRDIDSEMRVNPSLNPIELFEKKFIYSTPLDNSYRADDNQKALIVSSLILALSYGAFDEDLKNETIEKILKRTLDFRNKFNEKNNIKFLLSLRFTNHFIKIISDFLEEDINKEVSPILLILMIQNKHSLLLSKKMNLDNKMFDDMGLLLNDMWKDRTIKVENQTRLLYSKLNDAFKSYCSFNADKFKMLEINNEYKFIKV